MLEIQEIGVRLVGLADIIFDRFIDHSKVRRPPEQKLYLAANNLLVLPQDNLTAFLFGDDPPGCARTFEGKAGKSYLRMGLSHVFIKEALVPFLDADGQEIQFSEFETPFWIHRGSPRVKQGSRSIKQEMKERPVLKEPWGLVFTIQLIKNTLINENKLCNWFMAGGLQIGLGTYRPRFGRFEVLEWNGEKMR